MKNPNAGVAAGGSGLSVLVVWVLGHFHVALSAEDGAIVAGVIASVVLFVGRNGLKGIAKRLWGGQGGMALLEVIVVLLMVAVVVLLVRQFH